MPPRVAVSWSRKQALAARAAVVATSEEPRREAILVRFERARVLKGSTHVTLNAKQAATVATALAKSDSPLAQSALSALERDVLKAAARAGELERKDRLRPDAVLNNARAAQREVRARHVTGKSRRAR